MIGYYNATELIRAHLLADRNINTVVIGGLDKVDITKQTIFPLAHILIDEHYAIGGKLNYSIKVAVMDIVKTNIIDEFVGEDWKLIDNNQDILNTMQSVIESLESSLRGGTLSNYLFEVRSDVILTPFEYRFENILTGWEATFDLTIPNNVTDCTGSSFTLDRITFSNCLITFSNDNCNC